MNVLDDIHLSIESRLMDCGDNILLSLISRLESESDNSLQDDIRRYYNSLYYYVLYKRRLKKARGSYNSNFYYRSGFAINIEETRAKYLYYKCEKDKNKEKLIKNGFEIKNPESMQFR